MPTKTNEDVDEETQERETETREKEVAFYNVNDGLGVRDGGPYLDILELQEAERRRAWVENREPDYSQLHGSPGVVMVDAGVLARHHSSTVSSKPLADLIEEHEDDDEVGPVPLTRGTVVFEVTPEEQIQEESAKSDVGQVERARTSTSLTTPAFPQVPTQKDRSAPNKSGTPFTEDEGTTTKESDKSDSDKSTTTQPAKKTTSSSTTGKSTSN